MSGSFAITVPTDTAALGPDRQARSTFTVSNLSGQTLRGRARVSSQNPAAAAWLTLEGTAERKFLPDGTQQFSVAITVPPQATPGSYVFSLDMLGTDNPDEDFSQGPCVTVTVPAAPPPPHKFPWWLVVTAAVILLAVAATVAVVMLRRAKRVPIIRSRR
jgi:hypothetical protein